MSEEHSEEMAEHALNLEIDSIGCNQLNTLGNRAIQLGLIVGHGYRGGKYELLSKEEVVLLPPDEALKYLQTLVDEAER